MQKTESYQLIQLQNRFQSFVEKLETLEPEKVNVKEIDRLIQIIDEIEKKCVEVKEQV